jgi:hypothetical protein
MFVSVFVFGDHRHFLQNNTSWIDHWLIKLQLLLQYVVEFLGCYNLVSHRSEPQIFFFFKTCYVCAAKVNSVRLHMCEYKIHEKVLSYF